MDPLCKDGKVQFTTVLLKPLSDQQCGGCSFKGLKVFDFEYSFIISCSCKENPHLKISIFQNYEQWYNLYLIRL